MKKTIIASLLVLLTAPFALAQTESRTSVYIGAEIEKEFSKKLSAELEAQGRFCPDKSSQDFLLTPSIEFAPIKYFSLGAEYRLEMEHEDGAESQWSGRFGAFAKAKYSLENFKMEARLKYCNYSEDYLEDGNLQYLRTKFQLAYKIKPLKLTPYASYEIFYNLTRDPRKVDKDRYTVGVKDKVSKHHTIGFEYQLEEKFNRVSRKGNPKNDINNNIFSFYYRYTLPRKKNESQKTKD